MSIYRVSQNKGNFFRGYGGYGGCVYIYVCIHIYSRYRVSENEGYSRGCGNDKDIRVSGPAPHLWKLPYIRRTQEPLSAGTLFR